MNRYRPLRIKPHTKVVVELAEQDQHHGKHQIVTGQADDKGENEAKENRLANSLAWWLTLAREQRNRRIRERTCSRGPPKEHTLFPI